jgi:hypothetical protein
MTPMLAAHAADFAGFSGYFQAPVDRLVHARFPARHELKRAVL